LGHVHEVGLVPCRPYPRPLVRLFVGCGLARPWLCPSVLIIRIISRLHPAPIRAVEGRVEKKVRTQNGPLVADFPRRPRPAIRRHQEKHEEPASCLVNHFQLLLKTPRYLGSSGSKSPLVVSEGAVSSSRAGEMAKTRQSLTYTTHRPLTPFCFALVADGQ